MKHAARSWLRASRTTRIPAVFVMLLLFIMTVSRICHRLGCCAVTPEGYIAVAVRGNVIVPTDGDSSAHSRMRRHCVAIVESLAGRQVAALDVTDVDKTVADSRPCGIVVTEDGHVIVSDVGNNCIMIYNADFRLIRRFGRRGSRSSQFKSPRHLAVTPKNDIVVSDYGNHAVKVSRVNYCRYNSVIMQQ
jgi:DNA-binding beta-propeller fold protein YncE